MPEISSRYNPKETEDRWYKFWQEKDLFSASTNTKKDPFCIVIPPPNITGILHMGHALNNTYQDILIRYKKMKGFESLWMPGTDHAGIATQNVVERSIAKEGLKRQDLGREKFLGKLQQWREQYGNTITEQLKKLGCSCDWRRTRFTMDEDYSKAVKKVFVSLWKKGLIYQGDYIINWCPRCQTALSDEEAPHQDVDGKLYHIKYPLSAKGGSASGGKDSKDYITVATTRPETMLGDTAVAVNPKDKRFKKMIGKTLILPLMSREIKIIADSFVDPEFGTGLVKVTPAHDPNDYEMGKRHNLEFINIMHPNGVLNKNAGKYAEMDRFAAREAILEDLKTQNLLEKIDDHAHSVGHCYRCHTAIEPYLSRQWFVKMKPLAKPAIDVVKKNKVKFYPARWKKVYLNWTENIRDWCISRQIWWGHRIPVWYCLSCKEVIASAEEVKTCTKCKSSNLKQDEDVLDTWFSSWLWPFATFYWASKEKNKDLSYFYPTSTLVTAPEILFFWVARMIMAGIEFMDDIPFKDVYIHGTVRDLTGKKMSKSLGNVINPLEIIDKYGTDALRFSLISITAAGQDVFLSEEKFQAGRNFANKIWNASRFILSTINLDEIDVDLCTYSKKSVKDLKDKWILSRFYQTLANIEKSLDKYRFNEAVNTIYEFFWHEFCDWYLEFAKINPDKTTQIILYKILEKTLRILHPFMPFITEEIWQKLPCEGDSIMTSKWPHLQKQFISKTTDTQMQILIELITAIRNMRAQWKIELGKSIDVVLKPKDDKTTKLIKENLDYIKKLVKSENITLDKKAKRPGKSASSLTSKTEIFIPLEELIDIQKEKAGIENKIKEVGSFTKGIEVKLKNKNFIKKAPKQIVENEKNRFAELKDSLKRLNSMLKELQ